jgi:hypothetical protein
MKKIIISFASQSNHYGTNRFFRSQENLINTAKKYFDGYVSYTKETLDSKFIKENYDIMNQQKGCGYWLWKPYIILNTLKQLEDNDILFYVDGGNSIVNDPKCLFDLVLKDKKGLILFDNRDGAPANTIWKNSQWTKYDCFKKMNCLGEEYIKGNQVNASYVLLKKNNFTEKFIIEFYNYCQDVDILTDIPNKLGENFSDFIAHRHDQSILSLLSIKYNITIAIDPSEWGKNYKTDKYNYPVIFWHHRGFF